MVRHIVMWKIKDELEGQDKKALAAELRRRLEALPALIPQIKAFQVGDNFSPRDAAMDVALFSEFENREDLQAYAVHPDHQAVAVWIKDVVTETKVADWEYE